MDLRASIEKNPILWFLGTVASVAAAAFGTGIGGVLMFMNLAGRDNAPKEWSQQLADARRGFEDASAKLADTTQKLAVTEERLRIVEGQLKESQSSSRKPPAPSPSPVQPKTGSFVPGAGNYILAGEAGAWAPIRVDDYIEVRVNNLLLGSLRGLRTPTGNSFEIPPFVVPGRPGDLLALDAIDEMGGYFLDPVFVYSAEGKVSVTAGAKTCALPDFLCPNPQYGQPRRFIQAKVLLR